MEAQRLLYLINKYKDNTLSDQEQQELEHWYDSLNTGTTAFAEHTEVDQELADEMLAEFRQSRLRPTAPVRKLGFFKMFTRVAAVVTGISILSAGAYFLFFNRAEKPTEIVKTILPDDVKAPETNRAMITLANGQKVYLDSAVNGTLAMQGNVKLVKLANGQIAYQTASGETFNEIKYNTLENPRGSKVIDITLADGSQVWLNAGSSVTYPVAFVGNERKVAITGEAYFEVAHNTAMPFKVSKGEMEVAVLGTHFNVNAYDDEADIKVTLLEGSVKIIKGSTSGLLKPGQQAKVTNELKVVNGVDMEQVMAWKDGVFRFRNTNIGEIMRQIARWYDVQIEYKGNFSDLNFGGSVSRQANVSELLKRLEATEAVKFKVEGRKIIVMMP